MPTVREIAEQAGVSKSTVSLVLNNKPGVSETMRQLVLDARAAVAQQKQTQREYVQPGVVRREVNRVSSANSVSLSIVVLHPPVPQSSYVFREVLNGIQTAAQAYNLQLRLISNDANVTEHHVSRLYFSDPNLRPDGVIVFGAQQHEPLLDDVLKLGIPSVVLGRNAGEYDVSGIGRDEERHAYQATSYLVALGHRAVAFIGGEIVYDYWHTRLQGYERALEDVGVDVMDRWIQPGDGQTGTQAVLEQAPEVTALIYVNDTCAVAGLPTVKKTGLRIPRDISVVSFDDTDIAQEYDPPLTSISYKRFEEGQWAVKMLIDQIQYPYLERVQTLFDADFVVRESCAPPKA